ncbi:MAG: archaellin/type IV pilin N-terminal domain-containing protein [Nanoarchaeota archaeon]
MKSKKGISPLIATVLLIGFTIVLAALVMRWGGQFFRQQTDVVGCESEGQIQCTSGVDLVIENVLGGVDQTTISVLNNGNYDIGEVQYVVLDNSGVTINSTRDITGIGSLNGDTVVINTDVNTTTTIGKVKVIPILNYEMKDGSTTCVVYCSETTKTVLGQTITTV